MAVGFKKKRLRTRRVLAASLACVALLTALGFGGAALLKALFPSSSAPAPAPNSSASSSSSPVSSSPYDPSIRPISTATIINTGDILIHESVLNGASQGNGKYHFDSIFTYIAPYLQKADYGTINLELSLPGSNYSGYPRFRTPDSLIDSLKTAGFDLVTTANNHSNDSGATGFMRTMQVLQQKGMAFIGTRPTVEDKNYHIQNINGIAVGMINYTYGSYLSDGKKALNGIPCTKETSPLVNMFSYDRLQQFYAEMEASIDAMKQDGAEAVIAYIHWGNEYRLSTTATQREMAQKLCDLGVDVIVGSHPHVIEPVQLLTSSVSGKSTLCVYSMGNSVSNQRIEEMTMKSGHTEDGMLFSFTLTKYSDGSIRVTDADILPTWVHLYRQNGKKVYQIIPLDSAVQDWSAFGLNNTSSGLANAQKSYDRTMDIVSDGLSAFRTYFQQQQQQLDEYNDSLLVSPAA